MIRCLPIGICSWDFRLDDGRSQAVLNFSWMTEQGLIRVDGEEYEVVKHGFASGRWTLQRKGQEVVEGYKPSMFTRTFELTTPDGRFYELRAVSPFGRGFQLDDDIGRRVAFIEPDHLFTRRSRVHADQRSCEFSLLCFAFWLVVISWRRSSNNTNSAG